jgi:hypothetical protein
MRDSRRQECLPFPEALFRAYRSVRTFYDGTDCGVVDWANAVTTFRQSLTISLRAKASASQMRKSAQGRVRSGGGATSFVNRERGVLD